MTSFLTSILSAITRRWGRADDRVEPDQLETIADVVPAIVWIAAADKSCTYVNEQWLRFSGRRREEELGFGWVSAMHPDDVPRCMPVFESAFEAREPVEIEYRQRRHDGVFRWMLSRGVPRFDRDGGFSGYIGVVIDIDDMGARWLTKDGRAISCSKLAEAAPLENAAPPNAAPDLRRKLILVVDTDPDSLESLAEALREFGARVTTVRSAAEAILALCSHHDLVVTDAGVVVTAGVTLAQQLRQANGGVPAIVLRKPVDPRELAAEIARLLTRPGGA